MTRPEQVSPVLTLLLMTLLVRAAVAAWMHPEYRAYRAGRRAARRPLCPCGCGRPPGQHNPPVRLPRQRTPKES